MIVDRSKTTFSKLVVSTKQLLIYHCLACLNSELKSIRYEISTNNLTKCLFRQRERLPPLKHYCQPFLAASHLSDERLVTSTLFH